MPGHRGLREVPPHRGLRIKIQSISDIFTYDFSVIYIRTRPLEADHGRVIVFALRHL